MYKPNCMDEPGVTISAHKYQFCAPYKLNVRRKDGLTVLTGFGIGDIIDIMEPNVQTLVCNWETWKEIPLADGSILLDPDGEITQIRYLNEKGR